MPIVVNDLRHAYVRSGVETVDALRGIRLTIADGQIVALIGPVGAGKSTLVQHLNGLLPPPPGTVFVDGVDVGAPKTDLQKLRSRIGLVFQYPEKQLFGQTVADDVAFGPRNVGVPEEQLMERVSRALRLVGLQPTDVMHRSPFTLSGGERRRVALAGVLVMSPRYVVLDEPTAGLDAAGRRDLWRLLHTLRRERGVTVVLITHDMQAVAEHADDVCVIKDGRVLLQGTPADVFAPARRAMLEGVGLELPPSALLLSKLAARGWILPTSSIREQAVIRTIAEAFGVSG